MAAAAPVDVAAATAAAMAAVLPRDAAATTAAAAAATAAAPTAEAMNTMNLPAATAGTSAAPPRGGDKGADRDEDSHAATVAATPDGSGEQDSPSYRRCCQRARLANPAAAVQRRL